MIYFFFVAFVELLNCDEFCYMIHMHGFEGLNLRCVAAWQPCEGSSGAPSPAVHALTSTGLQP